MFCHGRRAGPGTRAWRDQIWGTIWALLRLSSGCFPRYAIHGTLLLTIWGVQPLDETVHMEYMAAFAPYEWTAIAWNCARRAACIVSHLADAAYIFILDVPRPISWHCPCINLDLHMLDQWLCRIVSGVLQVTIFVSGASNGRRGFSEVIQSTRSFGGHPYSPQELMADWSTRSPICRNQVGPTSMWKIQLCPDWCLISLYHTLPCRDVWYKANKNRVNLMK